MCKNIGLIYHTYLSYDHLKFALDEVKSILYLYFSKPQQFRDLEERLREISMACNGEENEKNGKKVFDGKMKRKKQSDHPIVLGVSRRDNRAG